MAVNIFVEFDVIIIHRKRDPAKKLQDSIDLFQRFKSETSQHVKSSLEDREQ